MTEDTTIIRIKGSKIGIAGLEAVCREVWEASGSAGMTDTELQQELLNRLGRRNYIPQNVREDYGRAFLREYKRFAGLPFQEEEATGLEIKVYGPGCSRCDQLERSVYEVLDELGLPGDVEHVRDPKEIAKAGIMGPPGLMINGRVLAVGKVPAKDRLKAMIREAGSPS